VVWRLGAGPFLDGVRALDGRAFVAAAAIVLVTTVCFAWRWKTVADGLGLRLSLVAAVAAYYRALFLNLTLPGGVAGDVHRGVRHGRDVRNIGHAMRAVAWERGAGQVVQVLVTIPVLFLMPSPLRSSMPFVALGLAATAAVVILAVRAWTGRGHSGGNVRATRRWQTSAKAFSTGAHCRRSCSHRQSPSSATCSPS
jgi:uncharacterized membrane protein YbhN (UPF0104 family)